MTDSSSQKFVLDFFKQVDDILEKKRGGGKRNPGNTRKRCKSNKKQRGGMQEENELVFPIPIRDRSVFDLIQLQETIKQSPSLKNSVKVDIIPSKPIQEKDISSEFSNHIKVILDNITTKPAFELSPQELQVMALFISFKNMKTEVENASKISQESIQQIQALPSNGKVVIEDNKSSENLQMVSTLLVNVPGPTDMVDKQTQVMTDIIEHSLNNVMELTTLYETDSSPLALSSASTSSFLNLFGYLSVLMDLLLCYKNRINEYGTSLKTSNPVIYFIMSSIYSCMSFVVFLIYKLFMILINTKIGKIYLTFVFLKLYKENNAVAVFIANMILKLLSIADETLGASEYVINKLEIAKQLLIAQLPQLLTNASISGLLSTVISTALASPTVLANFINSLSPELSSQIIKQALPSLSQSVTTALSNASPEMIRQLTEGVSMQLVPQITQTIAEGTLNMASSLTPALIEGVTNGVAESVTPMITNAVADAASSAATLAITEGAKAAASQQLTSTFMNNVGTQALGYTAYLVGNWLGAPQLGDVAHKVLTNKGGKHSKKMNKRKSKMTKGGKVAKIHNKKTHKRRK